MTGRSPEEATSPTNEPTTVDAPKSARGKRLYLVCEVCKKPTIARKFVAWWWLIPTRVLALPFLLAAVGGIFVIVGLEANRVWAAIQHRAEFQAAELPEDAQYRLIRLGALSEAELATLNDTQRATVAAYIDDVQRPLRDIKRQNEQASGHRLGSASDVKSAAITVDRLRHTNTALDTILLVYDSPGVILSVALVCGFIAGVLQFGGWWRSFVCGVCGSEARYGALLDALPTWSRKWQRDVDDDLAWEEEFERFRQTNSRELAEEFAAARVRMSEAERQIEKGIAETLRGFVWNKRGRIRQDAGRRGRTWRDRVWFVAELCHRIHREAMLAWQEKERELARLRLAVSIAGEKKRLRLREAVARARELSEQTGSFLYCWYFVHRKHAAIRNVNAASSASAPREAVEQQAVSLAEWTNNHLDVMDLARVQYLACAIIWEAQATADIERYRQCVVKLIPVRFAWSKLPEVIQKILDGDLSSQRVFAEHFQRARWRPAPARNTMGA